CIIACVHATFVFSCFCFMVLRPLRSPLFPYTTLFRSVFAFHFLGRGTWSGLQIIIVGQVVVGENLINGFTPNTTKIFVFKIYGRSEEHTSELQSRENLVCRLLLEKKKKNINILYVEY